VPRAGGNNRSGSFFFNYSDDAFQGTNAPDNLPAGVRPATEDLLTMREFSAAVGGPLKRDRLWYFVSARTKLTEKQTPLMFYNANAGTDSWFYVADRSRPAFNDSRTHAGNVRLTWQAAQRHKIGLFFDEQSLKDNHEGGGTATISPEAAGTADAYPQHLVQVTWQSPWT
jgi:hypothetical protein